MKPQRIQRKRTKGWRMPANAVYVGRPTQWGNPFTGFGAVLLYEKALTYYARRSIKRELRGKDLVCWCPLDRECHADILLKVANR